MKSIYRVKLIASNVDSIIPEHVVADFEVETADIANKITHMKWDQILRENGHAIQNLGTVYELYDGYASLGHEGDDFGNTKTICQFAIEWELIC